VKFCGCLLIRKYRCPNRIFPPPEEVICEKLEIGCLIRFEARSPGSRLLVGRHACPLIFSPTGRIIDFEFRLKIASHSAPITHLAVKLTLIVTEIPRE
jgi:hypothetical protein